MSINSPIIAISSSNNSGYSVVFTQNGFRNPLAIYGHHLDNVIHVDAALQSPFTNQHVGGLQHRHQPINQGTDSRQSRIESIALEVSGGSIYIANPRNSGITGAAPTRDINIPYSQIGRNVWVKRPVNIANIQYTTASNFIGNYTKSYQFYQTSNRKTNNLAFVQRGGYSVQYVESVYTSGTYDFALPNRSLPNGTYDQSVIVERFSAPGGPEVMSEGFLDAESGQFSVYNALPYRNLSVRIPLTNLLSIPMEILGGYQSGSTVTASYHKINQNPRRIMVYSNVVTPTYATSSEKDNAFINHSIPRSDSQYTWITASIEKTNQEILFFLNVLSMSATNERTSSYDGVNSFYGWSTWRQIRNYERRSATYLRRNNLLASSIGNSATDTDENNTSQNSRNYVFTISDARTIVPLTIKYKPIIATIESEERVARI